MHTYIHRDTQIHIYVQTDIYIYMHACIHIYVYRHMYIEIKMHMYVFPQRQGISGSDPTLAREGLPGPPSLKPCFPAVLGDGVVATAGRARGPPLTIGHMKLYLGYGSIGPRCIRTYFGVRGACTLP